MLRFIAYVFMSVTMVALVGAGGVLYVLYHFGRDLPDYHQLAIYAPPTVTRVHAGDGRLLAEYAIEKRVFVPVAAMPRRVVNAFLAAEDKNFFTHPGVDFLSVVRATLTNLGHLAEDRRPVGGSTITQQVAKNFLLSNELSVERKIKEAILAFRIERALPKDRILELYLNEIYLGFGSYGVAAAALNYFNKSLDDLTLSETAYLAALPKAPNNYHPTRQPVAAKARRDWVLDRMVAENVITPAEAAWAREEPIIVRKRSETEFVRADYFTEEVRRALMDRYGEEALYEGGLSVRTAMDPWLQDIAERALRAGLEIYDRRHGWRGPITQIPLEGDWRGELAALEAPALFGARQLAVVLDSEASGAYIGLINGASGFVPLEELAWARAWQEGETRGPKIQHPNDVVTPGDVVVVEPLIDGPEGSFALHQIPAVNGALVALDPHTGRVLALVGGYDYEASQFNRATQARRQPGSAFKPFVYAAALDHGFTPSSLILDAPIVIDQGPGLAKWKPANYTRKFYGPSTLRLGIEKSRNLMTVRLARYIGMEAVADYAERFGVVDDMPTLLSSALGAAETTLLRLTTAYAIFVNGGHRIAPTLIDRVQDRWGKTIFRHDTRPCPGCMAARWHGQPEPTVPDAREQVVGSDTAYQVVSLLRGVVQRGTGVRVNAVRRPLAGKTGTTNESIDTWFLGFAPDLAVGVYVGFDNPRSLGKGETGSSVAAPIFRDFMAEALADEPEIPFRIPPGIRLVRVDATTGAPAKSSDGRVILEAFKPGTEPTGDAKPVLDDPASLLANGQTVRSGTGGLY